MSSVSKDLIEIELTTNCNANCIFCPREYFNDNKYISKDTLIKTIERAEEANISKIKFVGYGEPTLHPNIIDLMTYTKQKKMTLILNTNGSYLNKFDFDWLLNTIDQIIISVHSFRKDIHKKIFGVDFFDKLLKNIRLLLKTNNKYNKQIYFYCVKTELNPFFEKDSKRLFKDNNNVELILSGCSNRTIPNFNKDIIIPSLNQQYNHYPYINSINKLCGYALNFVSIDVIGNYRICSNDISHKIDLGNVFTQSIDSFRSLYYKNINKITNELCITCDNYF